MSGNQIRDRRRFLFALAGAAFAAPALGGPAVWTVPRAGRRWAGVRRLIDRYVAEGKVAGAVAALSVDGDPPAYPAAGRIALDAPARFDENSICRIYSMSKAVTGVAAMSLVEDRRIALDQPVADVLPEWRSLRVAVDLEKGLDSRPARNVMTMRHLLTHTSGLGYWNPESGEGTLTKAYRERGITPGNYGAGLSRPGYGPQAKGLVEMIRRVAELPLAFEPGTAWQYAIGLDVMGLVIERVTGKRFEAFLRERLFGPLDMPSTGFQVAAKDAARLTTNYTVTAEGLRPVDPAATSVWLSPPPLPAGGAGLVSTARDFWRFGAMLLGDGALGRARVLKPATARLVRSNLLPAGVVYPRGGGFGAGVRVVVSSDGRYGPVGSFGWGGAAGTNWRVDPARRVNAVFMTQFMPPTSYSIWDEFPAALEEDLRAGTT
jgi:CubicO group peptidase (beta-lactamase class C family)